MRRVIFLACLFALAVIAACAHNAIPDDGDTGIGADAALDGTTLDAKLDAKKDGGEGGADVTVDTGASFDFMVVRVGGSLDAGGADVLTTAATETFVEERKSIDGTLIRTLAMPTIDGGGFPVTLPGVAQLDGALATSADGKYVTFGAYGAVPGTANVANTSAAAVKRIVVRIDKAGTIDSTTYMPSTLGGGNIRGATTDDGNAFWVVGSASGVMWVSFGGGTVTTLANASTNNREIQIFGNQLYGSTGAGTSYRIFSVGTGVQNTTGQTMTNLPMVLGNSPDGFLLMDLDAAVTGMDTLYVGDVRAPPNGGVQKWTNNGTQWSLAATFNDTLTGGCQHVTGVQFGKDVHIVCATDETPSRLVRFVDDGVNVAPTPILLSTAQTSTAFHGVAISPK